MLPDVPENEYSRYSADQFGAANKARIDAFNFGAVNQARIQSLPFGLGAPGYETPTERAIPLPIQLPQMPQLPAPPQLPIGTPTPLPTPTPTPTPMPGPPPLGQPQPPAQPPIITEPVQGPALGEPPRRPLVAPPGGVPQVPQIPQPPGVPQVPQVGGDLRDYARQAATQAGIDPNIFVAQIQQESGFEPFSPSGKPKTSPAGAIGIAQFMPGTAAGMQVDPTDPYASLDAAARLDAQHLQAYGGDWPKTLAAYNAGPGNVASGAWQSIPETQAYVSTILGNAANATAGVATSHLPSPPIQGTGIPSILSTGTVDDAGRMFPLPVRPDNSPTATYHSKGGSDLMAPRGTPVAAMQSGKVVETFQDSGDHQFGGNAVLVHGDDGLDYYYAHFDQPSYLRPGDTVQAGQQIGGVGNSGNAFKGGQGETHLHIGIGYGISSGTGSEGGLGENFNAQALLTGLENGVPTTPAPPQPTQPSAPVQAQPGVTLPSVPQSAIPSNLQLPTFQQRQAQDQQIAPPPPQPETAALPRPAAANPLEDLGNVIGNAISNALGATLSSLGLGPPGPPGGNQRRQEDQQRQDQFSADTGTLGAMDLNQPSVQQRAREILDRFGRNPVTGEPGALEQATGLYTSPPRTLEEAANRALADVQRRGIPFPGPGGALGILQPGRSLRELNPLSRGPEGRALEEVLSNAPRLLGGVHAAEEVNPLRVGEQPEARPLIDLPAIARALTGRPEQAATGFAEDTLGRLEARLGISPVLPANVPQAEEVFKDIGGPIRQAMDTAAAAQPTPEELRAAQTTYDAIPKYRGTDTPMGAPPDVTDAGGLARVQRVLSALADEGASQKDWYTDSSDAIKAVTGNDPVEGEKLAQLLAIYSPNNSVTNNTEMALKAWYQYQDWLAQGRPQGVDPIRVGMARFDQKANDLLVRGDQWEGRKTNNFYRNLMKSIDPTVHTSLGAETGQTGVTVDIWMMRALGYDRDNPTPAQYDFVANQIAQVARDHGWTPDQAQAAIWSAIKAGSENTRVESAGYNYATGLGERAAQMSWTASPGSAKAQQIPGYLDAPQAERAVFNAVSERAKYDPSTGRDPLAQAAGITRGQTIEAPEVYGQYVGPGLQTEVPVATAPQSYTEKVPVLDAQGNPIIRPKGRYRGTVQTEDVSIPIYQNRGQVFTPARNALDAYSAMHGIIYNQDAVPWTRLFMDAPLRDSNAVVLDIGRPLTANEAQQINAALTQTLGEDAHAVVSSRDGAWILNLQGGFERNPEAPPNVIEYQRRLPMQGPLPEGVTRRPGINVPATREERVVGTWVPQEGQPFRANQDFYRQVREALSPVELESDATATLSPARADGNYIANDWEANPNGEDYRQILESTGRARAFADVEAAVRDRVQRSQADVAARLNWPNDPNNPFAGAQLADAESHAAAALRSGRLSAAGELGGLLGREAGYATPRAAATLGGAATGGLATARLDDPNDPNRNLKIALGALAGGLGAHQLGGLLERGGARDLPGESLGSVLPGETFRGAPAGAADQNALQRFWNRMTMEFTDNRVSLNQIQEQYQREVGRPLQANEMAAFLARLTPGGAAEIRTEQGLGDAVQSVGQHYPSLVDYVTAKSLLSTAEGLGRKTEATLADVPIPRAIRNQVADAERLLAQRQRDLDALQRASTNSTGIPGVHIPTQQQLNGAARLVRQGEEILARRQDRAQAAAEEVLRGAGAEGAKVARERVFSGGMTRQDAIAALDRLQSELPPEVWDRVQQAGDQVFDYSRQLRQRLVDAGVMSEQQARELDTMYPEWARTRILDYMNNDSPRGMAAGSKLGLADRAMHAYTLEGTPRAREDPIASMIAYTDQVERMAMKNEQADSLLRLDQRSRDPQLRQVVSPSEYAQLESTGADMSRYATNVGPGETTLNLFRQGEKQQYVTGNKFLAEAINGVDRVNLPDWARKPADIIRMAATARNPAFLAGNAALDIPQYLVRTSAGGGAGGVLHMPMIFSELVNGYRDAFQGMLPTRLGGSVGGLIGGAGTAAMTDPNDPNRNLKIALGAGAGAVLGGRSGITNRFEGENTQRFLLGGGGMAGQYRAFEPVAAAQKLEALRRGNVFEVNSPSDLNRIIQGLVRLRWVESIGQRVELGPRVAAMRVAERRGLNPVQAVIAGRNVTVDFDRGGRSIKFLNQFMPFLNAGFQGSAQLFRLARENPAGAATALATLVGAPTIASEAWNNADPQRARDYADVPQYLKDTGIVFMLPFQADVDPKTGNRKPAYVYINMRELAPAVQMAREAAHLAAGQGLTRDWREVAGTMALTAAPMQARSPQDAASRFIALPAAGTALQLGANQDFYRGSTIVSQRADDNASPLSKLMTPHLQNALDAVVPNNSMEVRPSAIDFAMRDQLAGIGDAALGASRNLAGEEQAPGVGNIPVVGGLAGRFVRSTGGQRLDTARGEVLTPSARQALRVAGIDWTPSPVANKIGQVPLRYEEQAQMQELTNRYLDDAIQRVTRSSKFQGSGSATFRQKMLDNATGLARRRAQTQVLHTISPSERSARARAQSSAA